MNTVANQTIIDRIADAITAMEGSQLHHDPAVQEPTKGVFCPSESLKLHPDAMQLIRSRFPDGLYRHQHEAVARILAGDNTVVATRTSSGKSLIFSLPILNELCSNSDSTSLFLYPQKALANDQLLKLREFAELTTSVAKLVGDRPHFISRYDGATPQADRPQIRDEAQAILTNPDMLHYAMLQYHDSHWARFFANLKHVVIDECHEYRGIFGTNVAHILRRLRQVCKVHGSEPTFIATSATIHEPQSHMERLTGVDFSCVGSDIDGSRQGRRKFWMTSSDDHFYDYGRKLAFKLADEGLTVLAFCPGRMAAERMMARLLSHHDNDLPFVRVYRAGLSAMEREEIEHGLRDKSVRLVFSTSALELGIDIGEVDAVVCIGLPNSMMSLWQRAGRAARAGKDGGIVLIPGDTPIDTYYSNHPEELFAKDNEPLVLNTSNRRVVCQHYACATAEVGGDEDNLDAAVLGEDVAAVQIVRSEGKLDSDVFYRSEPHQHVNIRSIGEGNYKLVFGKDDDSIGEIDEFHLLREAYRNAIYRHGGKAYRVKDVIRGKKKVLLEREYLWNETRAFINKKIKLKRRHKIADYDNVMLATVDINVTEFLVSVTEKDRSGKIVNSWSGNMGMPTHTLPTEATLLRMRKPLWDEITAKLGTQVARTALQSCERLLWGLFPAVSGPCDKQDFSSASEVDADGSASIYLYDMVYDGVGLTTVACDRMHELIDKAIERLDQCACDTDGGCFRCIANPLSNESTSKQAARVVLNRLCDELAGTCTMTENETESPLDDGPATKPCAACETPVKIGDRFCSNCGEKQES
ncbi:ATP-dependent RNA helicase DbpA [Rosistilla oblonga]|uniref:DEAD/DEAH box helicase n=1 Tax=Rosistilla oblonga TaxID=2527990 RepID=UPI001188ABB7|nr:DEAD/DEAH box helicase [Rosistilla oblonga]QDV11491.1 ATP-dependent RNA helicase DbpA [Rosistilla oblonga]